MTTIQPSASPSTGWVNFSDILFDFDRADVRTMETDKISKIAEHMMQNADVRLAIAGFADPRGTGKYNQALSQRRVDAVRDELIRAGVPADRIQMGAYGATQHKCNEKTEQCWQLDRRVEVLVKPNGQPAGGAAKEGSR